MILTLLLSFLIAFIAEANSERSVELTRGIKCWKDSFPKGVCNRLGPLKSSTIILSMYEEGVRPRAQDNDNNGNNGHS